MDRWTRRRFLTMLGAAGVSAATAGGAPAAWGQADPVLAGRPLVRYPEKTDLILLTSRPAQL